MNRKVVRTLGILTLVSLAFAGLVASGQDTPPVPALAADRVAALDRISSDSLKGHLSFLASDLLEGRDTPSKGLDLAAEYIAAQFRRAGLEPVGDDGYFQTAKWEVSEPDAETFRFEIAGDGKSYLVDRDNLSFVRSGGSGDPSTAIIKLDGKSEAPVDLDAIAGKVVVVEPPGQGPARG